MIICHKVKSDGWTSCTMKEVGSASLGAMTSKHPFCSEMLHWDLNHCYTFWRHFYKKIGNKKERKGGATFQRIIEFSLFKRVYFHERFFWHIENNIFSQSIMVLIVSDFLWSSQNTLFNCLGVLIYSFLSVSLCFHAVYPLTCLCFPNK